MKSQLIIFAGLLLFVTMGLPVETDAQGRRDKTYRSWKAPSDAFRTPSRGMGMSLDMRPVLELENLTEDQKSEIDDMQREFVAMQIELHDQVRELLDEETYIEWRTMWSPRNGQRNIGPRNKSPNFGRARGHGRSFF